MAVWASLKYSESTSIPMLSSPQAVAAAIVEPEPMNGSKIVPSASGRDARTICRMKPWGFKVGWGAIFFSSPRAGEE